MNYDRFYSHSTIFQLLVCCILWHSLQVGPTPFLYIKRARDSVNVCGWYIMEVLIFLNSANELSGKTVFLIWALVTCSS
jgi:hypothetical protein